MINIADYQTPLDLDQLHKSILPSNSQWAHSKQVLYYFSNQPFRYGVYSLHFHYNHQSPSGHVETNYREELLCILRKLVLLNRYRGVVGEGDRLCHIHCRYCFWMSELFDELLLTVETSQQMLALFIQLHKNFSHRCLYCIE